MPVHIADSLIYRNSWGTDEARAIFDDEPRTRAWLEILAALAEAQAAGHGDSICQFLRKGRG